MPTCPDCGTTMKELIFSLYCPNDCDRKDKTSKVDPEVDDCWLQTGIIFHRRMKDRLGEIYNLTVKERTNSVRTYWEYNVKYGNVTCTGGRNSKKEAMSAAEAYVSQR